MAEHISVVLEELVTRGVPCDPIEVRRPCWYTLATRHGHQLLEGWGYEPYQLQGNHGILWIYPPTQWFLEVGVYPDGRLGRTRIAVNDEPLEDPELGTLSDWPGLRRAVQIGSELYSSALRKEQGHRTGAADHG